LRGGAVEAILALRQKSSVSSISGASAGVVFVEQAVAAPPEPPHLGLEHLGLRVDGIDAVVAELKAKGAEFTVEPKTIRPGVRIAFLRGPQNVPIELLDKNPA
jgi:lactoylglutathione lyase